MAERRFFETAFLFSKQLQRPCKSDQVNGTYKQKKRYDVTKFARDVIIKRLNRE
jgi:hypothetical protein